MDASYSFNFRGAQVADIVSILEVTGTKGVVLGSDTQWATAILPRSDDERARLRLLAEHHPAGVLLYSVGPSGDRILWQRDSMLVVDALAAQRLFADNLISPVHLAQLGVVSPRGHEWSTILRLPAFALRSDAVLSTPFVDLPGAVSVGIDVGVPAPPVRPRTPRTGQELFKMLVDTGSVELDAGADTAALAQGFADQLVFGGSATGAWLLEQDTVAEVYVSDEALQMIIDEAWPVS